MFSVCILIPICEQNDNILLGDALPTTCGDMKTSFVICNPFYQLMENMFEDTRISCQHLSSSS